MSNIANELQRYKSNILGYKNTIEELKKRKLIEQNNLEHIVKREQEVIEEIKSKGINPNELTSSINSKMDSIRDIMGKLQTLIPQDGSIPSNVNEILGDIKQSSAVNEAPSIVEDNRDVNDIDLTNFTLDEDFPL